MSLVDAEEKLEKTYRQLINNFKEGVIQYELDIKRLKIEISVYREQLGLIAFGHEYSCGSNKGLKCTCRAGIASAVLKKMEEPK